MYTRPKILLVDDEPAVVENLSPYLSINGLDIISAGNGEEALAKLASEKPDVMVLDVNMPKVSGVEVLHEMQRRNDMTPVVVMTAYGRDNSLDVIVLNYDAHHYLDKPFQNEQLLARVNRILRQMQRPEEPSPPDNPEMSTLIWDSLHLDQCARQVFWQDVRVHLQPKEFALLAHLMENSQRFFSRTHLLNVLPDSVGLPEGTITKCKAGICRAVPGLKEIIEAYDGGYIFNAKVERQ